MIALTPRKSPEVRLLSTELQNHLARLGIRVSDLQLSVEAELKKWRQLFKREQKKFVADWQDTLSNLYAKNRTQVFGMLDQIEAKVHKTSLHREKLS